MKMDKTSAQIKAWRAEFLKQAYLDDFKEIQRHIDYLGIGPFEELFLESTIDLVIAMASYLILDNRDIRPLIKSQKYQLSPPDLPFYCLTFVIDNKNAGRLLTDQKMKGIDLSDLYDHPWPRIQTSGFQSIYVSRLDGCMLNELEMEEIGNCIEEDIYFDYSSDEIVIEVEETDLIDTIRFNFLPQY